ncbi:hypothetical protein [Methylobacterium sp. E-066]|uniref:hypothetical protein n=1 Tax=Methylobacterium sp. E-066 TaxID=2836584 RepID=UPI001FBA806D|nr:hypothetical protein [Methylobacterium sp. E-066]MCJ2138883.1 hypothetical protein [Methylobacterium sp. E-066]
MRQDVCALTTESTDCLRNRRQEPAFLPAFARGVIEQGAYSVTKSRRSGPRGPVVVNDGAVRPSPRERLFGGPAPDGPLPGRLLVLLSQLHRAEAAPRERRETPHT